MYYTKLQCRFAKDGFLLDQRPWICLPLALNTKRHQNWTFSQKVAENNKIKICIKKIMVYSSGKNGALETIKDQHWAVVMDGRIRS